MGHFETMDLELLRRIAAQKWGMAENDEISLAAADLDFPVAKEIKEGVIKALQEERVFYGGLQGDRDVLQIISDKVRKKNKLEIMGILGKTKQSSVS